MTRLFVAFMFRRMKIKLPNGVALETENEGETALLLEKLGLVQKSQEPDYAPEAAPVAAPPTLSPKPVEAAAPTQAEKPLGEQFWSPIRTGFFVSRFADHQVSGRVLEELYRAPAAGVTTVDLAKKLELENTKGLGSILGTFRRAAEEMGEPAPVQSHVGREGYKVFSLDPHFRKGWAALRQQKGAA